MKKVSAVLLAITLVLFLFVSCGEFSVCDPNMMMGAASRTKNKDALTDDKEPQLVVWGKNWKTEKKREWAIDSSDWMSKFYIGSEGKVNPFTVNEIVFCKPESLPEKVEGGFDLSYLENKSITGYYKITDTKITFGKYDNTQYYYCNAYILYIVADKIVANYFCDYMFSQFKFLTKITGLDTLDTSSTVSMTYMFHECNKLSDYGFLQNWNVSHVSDMSGMFYNCNSSSFKTIDLKNWNPAKIKQMDSMFYGCKNLSTLDLSSFIASTNPGRYYIFGDPDLNTKVPTTAIIYVASKNDWYSSYFSNWKKIQEKTE